MLSGETTKGEYPLEAVRTMHIIAKNVQSQLKFDMPTNGIKTKDVKEALTLAACINAENLDARAIIVFSKTGKLLSLVTKQRPNINIFVFTDNEEVKRRLMIYWSTLPFKIQFSENFEDIVNAAIKTLKDTKYVSKDDRVVIVSDVNPRINVDILEIRKIE